MPVRDEIATFIGTTFKSVWALELLFLLKKEAGRALTRAEMVAGLRGSELAIAQGVDSLVQAELVTAGPDGAACYAPATAELGELVARTEARYAKRPDAVRRLIAAAAG